MKKTESRYTTFFYNGNKNKREEKNTYSGYIPSEARGIWALIVDSEMEENFAKAGVNAIFEHYFRKNEFSVENMNAILNTANKKMYGKKLQKNKDFNKKFSAAVVLSKDEDILIGNVGKSKVKIFRNNNAEEEISSNRIRKIELKKYDYIVIGSEIFWEAMEENGEIEEILSQNESKIDAENRICEKVEAVEDEKNILIPFMTIFIENLETEANVEEMEKKKEKNIESVENTLKYFLIFLIFMTGFGAVTKTFVEKAGVNKRRIVEKAVKKTEYGQQGKETAEEEKVKIPEGKAAKPEEKLIEKEAENFNLNGKDEVSEKKSEKSGSAMNRKISYSVKKTERKNKRKIKSTGEKKTGTLARKIRDSKVERFSDLDREIRENWKKLGRDENGNEKKVV